MVRASTKLEFAGGLATAMADAIGDKAAHRCLASCGAAASFPVPPSGQPEMVPANAVFVPERTTLCPDHAGSTTTAKPNFAGQIAVTSCGGWPGSPDRDGVWVGRRRRKGQQAVSLTRSCAECAVESRRGAVLHKQSVSPPRSSNRTCGFPASGSPTGFTAGMRRASDTSVMSVSVPPWLHDTACSESFRNYAVLYRLAPSHPPSPSSISTPEVRVLSSTGVTQLHRVLRPCPSSARADALRHR